jgi:hypothetical protein
VSRMLLLCEVCCSIGDVIHCCCICLEQGMASKCCSASGSVCCVVHDICIVFGGSSRPVVAVEGVRWANSTCRHSWAGSLRGLESCSRVLQCGTFSNDVEANSGVISRQRRYRAMCGGLSGNCNTRLWWHPASVMDELFVLRLPACHLRCLYYRAIYHWRSRHLPPARRCNNVTVPRQRSMATR